MSSLTRAGVRARAVLMVTAATLAAATTASTAHASPVATFRPSASYATGLFPWGITAADLNGDGKPDAIVANAEYRQSGSLTVYLNNGDGTFSGRADYQLDTAPFEIVVSDLNGDGKADMAVSRGPDAGQGKVSVFPGNGDGTFGAPADFTVGDGPQSLSTGDLNRDGKPDVVAGNWLAASVSVLLNAGDGTFRETRYATDRGPEGVEIADMNSDGKLDVLTANFFKSSVTLLLGRGDGTFRTGGTFDAGDTANDLGVGDFDRDGKLDVITADFFVDSVSVLRGNGRGRLGSKTAFPTDVGPNKLKVADLNLDGIVDVVTSSWFVGTVSVVPGNGDGTFGPFTSARLSDGVPAVDVGDLDGDRKPDLVATDYDNSAMIVLLNTT